jgi:N-ethylmaleimide reductase
MPAQTKELIFAAFQLGKLTLQNRVVMAPMTRSRAPGGVPNAAMATYYGLRATAGLIITEGTSPSPNGLGYARIPGMYNEEQARGWNLTTTEVHAKGGHIFLQLMHCGRIGHPLNLPQGARLLAPSPIAAPGEMWTDSAQMQPHPVPEEMTLADIQAAVTEYAQSAKLAIEAGFDGIELHGANGYLIEQFLSPTTNQRTDAYGGTAENRLRFVLEVAAATAAAIGAERVGIRLSPFGAFNGIAAYDGLEQDYVLLASRLSALGLAYIHIVDHSSMGAPPLSPTIKQAMRSAFKQALILSGGYDLARAEHDVEAGLGDLVAFGKPFISNPKLVEKLKTGAALRDFVQATFYTPGEPGYLDYPVD